MKLKNIFGFILVLFLVLFNSSIILADNYVEAEKLNNEGLTYYGKQQYEEALDCFTRALEYYKEKTIWNNKGLALYRLNRFEEATEAFNEVIKMDSSYIDGWYNKGSALLNLYEYEEAITCFNKVLELEPSHSKAQSKKAQAEEALSARPTPTPSVPEKDWFEQGAIYYIEGNYEKAIECFNKVPQDDPNYDKAQQYIAEAENSMTPESSDEAKKEFEMAEKALQEENIQKAKTHFTRAYELAPEYIIDASVNSVKTLIAGNNVPEKIFSFINLLLEVAPNEIEPFYLKGLAFKEIHDYQKAIECFEDLMKMEAKDKKEEEIKKEVQAILDAIIPITEYFHNGLELYRNGQIEEAEELFTMAAAADPEHAMLVWKILAEEALEKENYQASYYCCNHYLSIDPGNTDMLIVKSDAARAMGNKQEALSCFNKAWEINQETTVKKIFYILEIEKGKEQYENILFWIEALLTVEPNNKDIWIAKGCTLEELENYEGALECFKKILELDPGDREAMNKKIELEAILKESNKGIPETILIPGGKFNMGSNNGDSNEQPLHTVEIKPFYMGKFEVTNEEFCEFLNEKGNQNEGGKPWIDIKDDNTYCGITGGPSTGTFQVKAGYEKLPAVFVNWYGAVAYCNWLSRKKA